MNLGGEISCDTTEEDNHPYYNGSLDVGAVEGVKDELVERLAALNQATMTRTRGKTAVRVWQDALHAVGKVVCTKGHRTARA